MSIHSRSGLVWDFQPLCLTCLLSQHSGLTLCGPQEWMAAYYDCAKAAMPSAKAQDCSNILTCLALMRMHEQQPAATAALAGHLAKRLQTLLVLDSAMGAPNGAVGITATVSEAAVLTPTPPHRAGSDLLEPMGASVDVSDQAMANSLWALAIMNMQPGGELWAVVVAALRQRLENPKRLAPGVHPLALTLVMWSSSKLGFPLPAAVTSLVYGRMRATQMEAMEPRSLATMVRFFPRAR